MDILTHQVSLFALVARGFHQEVLSFLTILYSDKPLFINLIPQLLSFAPISST